MRWSWKIGSFRGIGVYMHATFLLLIGFVVYSHWSAGSGVQKTLEGVGFILALFACVVLHEFGHALMAARYGIKTRDITLLPIGGLARLERMPDEPRQELWVALAGPAVNIAIAAVLFVAIRLTSAWAPLDQLSLTGGPLLARLLVVNLILAAFNMLPAFPRTADACCVPSWPREWNTRGPRGSRRTSASSWLSSSGSWASSRTPSWSSSPCSCGSGRPRRRTWCS
jgi:Zn-dependent protease